MQLDELYRVVTASPHGSSGRGMSFWGEANRCGRRARLNILNPMPEQIEGEDINPLRCGVFYHALHEAALRQNPGMVWDMTDSAVQDKDWMEALRIFRAYQKDWGSPIFKWSAQLVSVEEALPQGEETKALVRDLFGDNVTFRADWVGDILTEADIQRAYENTGLLLPEPGRYIFDHKQTEARKEIAAWDFQFGNQSVAYLHLYNLEHPNNPAKGMVFDQVIRHVHISKDVQLTAAGKVKRDSSYTHYLAMPNDDAEKLIRNIVQRGKYQIDHDLANASACFDGYKPCWYFTQGLCKRF